MEGRLDLSPVLPLSLRLALGDQQVFEGGRLLCVGEKASVVGGRHAGVVLGPEPFVFTRRGAGDLTRCQRPERLFGEAEREPAVEERVPVPPAGFRGFPPAPLGASGIASLITSPIALPISAG